MALEKGVVDRAALEEAGLIWGLGCAISILGQLTLHLYLVFPM